jgi:nickel-dependent lactate racemase
MVNISYGHSGVSVDLTGLNATVLRPRYPAALQDEAAAFKEAALRPYGGGKPLKERVSAGETLAVIIPDITRALPNERLLGWLFEELSHLPKSQITIVSGTGTHRANTPEEWVRMVGADIYRDYTCIDHVCDAPEGLLPGGTSSFGYPVQFNRQCVEADRRIVLGFIEPHFFAGFSGGYKAVMPGVADDGGILYYHSAQNIADPKSTWGVIEGNPTQDHVRAGGSLLQIDFCINVTLDDHERITAFFCGDTLPAHNAGCDFCRETAMAACPHDFPIVVTSNSGYPLDQNLYQCVKGMSAAAEVVRPGGLILMAGACNDGFPEHGNFRRMLEKYDSAEAMLEAICQPGFRCCDQWQVQKLAQILTKARVGLYSELTDAMVQTAHLMPVRDLRGAIDAELEKIGKDAPIAILPEGPMTIPYLKP